jgi:hypothetical protein
MTKMSGNEFRRRSVAASSQVRVFFTNCDANRPSARHDVADPPFFEATEKGIYYTSLRESTLHNNPPEFSYSDERSTLRRMFAF